MASEQEINISNDGSKKSLMGKMISWLLRHKIVTIVMVVVLIIFFEFLSLPSHDSIIRLKKENPRNTALMEQRKKEAADKGKKYSIRQQWVPLYRVDQNLIHAVIVAEDGTFYEHEGFDWYEVKESIKKDFEKGKFARGASTITQQLAKNLFLSTSKDPIRKLKEMIITSWLEDELSKERILEIYLNVIEWGDGIYGVESAASSYFNKHAAELSRDEAARLAAVIPNPLKRRPNTDARYVTFRKNVILARMEARGW
jgi:monofunctional glycosyltransferase